ncbi:MAG: hypothetical protein MJA28_11430 [Gammaproteobacteria bacterium]|nr:hypothetical protein [Gammaproteobacteria bacterium]
MKLLDLNLSEKALDMLFDLTLVVEMEDGKRFKLLEEDVNSLCRLVAYVSASANRKVRKAFKAFIGELDRDQVSYLDVKLGDIVSKALSQSSHRTMYRGRRLSAK